MQGSRLLAIAYQFHTVSMEKWVLYNYFCFMMMMLPIIAFFTHKCISLTVNIKPPFPIPVQAMQAYIDAGLTTFDMADIYGPAEEIFGHFNSQV